MMSLDWRPLSAIAPVVLGSVSVSFEVGRETVNAIFALSKRNVGVSEQR